MDNALLKQAKALYKDRLRIVISAMMIGFASIFYIFYNLAASSVTPPNGTPGGSTQALQSVASFNTLGFSVSILLLALLFRFWSWAFLPGPASTFTLAVLKGILGSRISVKQSIGKRFKVTLENGMQFEVSCRTRNRSTDEWFSYRLASGPLRGTSLKEIALRHGFALKDGKFVATVSSDELHQRTFLLTKAMIIANSAI